VLVVCLCPSPSTSSTVHATIWSTSSRCVPFLIRPHTPKIHHRCWCQAAARSPPPSLPPLKSCCPPPAPRSVALPGGSILWFVAPLLNLLLSIARDLPDTAWSRIRCWRPCHYRSCRGCARCRCPWGGAATGPVWGAPVPPVQERAMSAVARDTGRTTIDLICL
jgi:hypothetical protein